MKTVLFACVHNAGRSQMAAAFFNQLADPARARAVSAGTEPASRVHPEVVAAMREAGIDVAAKVPQRLTAQLAQGASLLVTMGCGETCPHVPGLAREDWPLSDPKGRGTGEVRAIRDDIRRRVEGLLAREGWSTRCESTADDLEFRLSTPADDHSLRALLIEAALPAEDVVTGAQQYVLAFEGERLVGAVGVEVAPPDGLLRSLAVRSDRRGRGLGAKLVERALALAALRDVRIVYLLTTTAQVYFAGRGFELVARTQLPSLVAEHAQFRTLCPSTAACMRRRIDRDAHWFPRDLLALRPHAPGAAFWAVALERAMLTYFEVEAGARFERHAHDAEQVTLVLDGELHFELEPGRVVVVGPGEVIALPSGVPHAAWAGMTPVRAVDAWSPPRTW